MKLLHVCTATVCQYVCVCTSVQQCLKRRPFFSALFNFIRDAYTMCEVAPSSHRHILFFIRFLSSGFLFFFVKYSYGICFYERQRISTYFFCSFLSIFFLLSCYLNFDLHLIAIGFLWLSSLDLAVVHQNRLPVDLVISKNSLFLPLPHSPFSGCCCALMNALFRSLINAAHTDRLTHIHRESFSAIINRICVKERSNYFFPSSVL